jgi:hypothetical protein
LIWKINDKEDSKNLSQNVHLVAQVVDHDQASKDDLIAVRGGRSSREIQVNDSTSIDL